MMVKVDIQCGSYFRGGAEWRHPLKEGPTISVDCREGKGHQYGHSTLILRRKPKYELHCSSKRLLVRCNLRSEKWGRRRF